jgi:hypothetical protein
MRAEVDFVGDVFAAPASGLAAMENLNNAPHSRTQLMKFFGFGHHGENCSHALLPGFGFLCGLQAIGNRVEVRLV